MDIRRGLVVVAVVVAVSIMLGSVAVAHHARSAYSEEDVILEGVVVSFTWRNPHVQVAFDVTDESGKTETWRGELSAVTSMIAAGTESKHLPGRRRDQGRGSDCEFRRAFRRARFALEG